MDMLQTRHAKYALGAAIIAEMALSQTVSFGQNADPNSAPNLYREDTGWAKLMNGRKWGAVSAVDIDRDGKSVWVFDRCETADDCSAHANLDPIQKFDASGKLVFSFGKGM